MQLLRPSLACHNMILESVSGFNVHPSSNIIIMFIQYICEIGLNYI